uniref:UDENN FLCN/SMCR8-type domain-containing protein n=1 Tax=Panagrolaimus superbus TaxID=310955 RepID=A0A914Z3Z2_9BILA
MTTQAVPRFITPSISTTLRRTNLPWDIIAEKEAEAPYTISVLSLMECNKPLNDLIDEKEDELEFGEWDRRIELVDEENRCPACTSLGDNAAHVANDYSMRRSFLSTQTAINDECYMVVKKAAFRAMIAEKLNSIVESSDDFTDSPSLSQTTRSKRLSKLFSLNSSDAHDEGVLLFGSDEEGYTAIVRTFILKDAKSRGFQRRYMFMALSEDRDMIVGNYKMIVNEFSTSARLLQ